MRRRWAVLAGILLVAVALVAGVRVLAGRRPEVRRAWRVVAAVAVRLVTGEGSVLVTLGDSNTCGWAHGCEHDAFFWPGRRTLPAGWRLDNVARPGLTAAERRACSNDILKPCDADAQCGKDGTCVAGTAADGEPQSGVWRMEQVIARYVPENRHACLLAKLGAAPQLLIALGTNDVVEVSGLTVAQRVLALYDRAHAALPCFELYVATLPPRRDANPEAVRQANVGIRVGMQMHGAGARVVPFDRQTPDELRPDGVHMTVDGQEHRAELAYTALGW
jgi:hypothetical protein